MLFTQFFVGVSLAVAAILAFVLAPVAGLVAVRSGTVDIGLTTATTAPTRSDHETVTDIRADERLVALTVPIRSRWLPLLVVGLTTVPIGWGAALIVYAFRLRNRPQYVFTEDRLLVERPDKTESVPLDDICQIQSGVSTLESFVNRGHVTFRIGDTRLETIPYLTDAEEFAGAITAAKAMRPSTPDRTAEPTVA